MSRILQIFRKDVRHLWPYEIKFLILMGLAAVLDPAFRDGHYSSSYDFLVSIAVPLACWFLVITVIHEEKLPGNRQYWLTRPYSWKELLAAKALFVVALINVPLLLWHIAAYAVTGVPLSEHWPALLWRQVFFTAFYVLPVTALAAITRSLGQAIGVVLVVALPFTFMETLRFGLNGVRWQNIEGAMAVGVAAIIAIAVAVILVLQYSRRRTAVSCFVAAWAVLSMVGATIAADKVLGNPRLSPEDSTIRISLDAQSGRRTRFLRDYPEIPLRMEGIPPDVDLLQNHLTLWIEDPEKPFSQPVPVANSSVHDVTHGTAWLQIALYSRFFGAMKSFPVNISGSIDFTAFGHSRTLSLPRGHGVVIPRVGVCSDRSDPAGEISFVCYSPLPRASLAVLGSRSGLNWIIPQGFVESGIPASGGFAPLRRFSSQLSYGSWNEIGAAQLLSAERLPQVRVSFKLEGIRLSDYVVGAPQ